MTESDSVSFKYTLTEKDYRRAMRAFLSSRLGNRGALAFIGLGFCGFIVTAITDVAVSGATNPNFWPTLGGLVVFVAAIFGLVRFCHWNAARKSPHVGIQYDVTFSAEGLTSRSSHGTAEARWSIYTGARETKDFFLLHSGANLFYPYPKTAFATPQDLASFRDLIRMHIPNAKLKNKGTGK
jgi:hypothetical protein